MAHFRLLRPLGSGGQGEVFEAHDEQLQRRVALKLLSRRFDTMAPETRELMRARFEREAEVAARVDHPGICSVHAFGEDDGVMWIAMRLVEGESLRSLVKRRRMAIPGGADEGPSLFASTTIAVAGETGEAPAQPDHADAPRSVLRGTSGPARSEIAFVIELIVSAARALHCAHESGLVHRDIKPGNLMATREGQAVVLDFGLAADARASHPSLTMTGDFIGTPAYMAPEQLLGRGTVDRRVDIYALGVTLFECLSLCPAFEAPTREALYRKIRLENPMPLRDLNPDVPRDLAIVVSAAMDKDPDRRYQTAADFADDLQRVLDHEPVHARPAGIRVRLVRWAQRDPVIASLIAALVLFAAVFVGWTSLKNEQLATLNGDLAQVNQNLRESKAEAERQAHAAARESRARGLALSEKSLALASERQAHAQRDRVLAEYERMADTRRLENARRDADALWPVSSELVARIDDWRERFRPLIARMPLHRQTLEDLRERALPYSEEARRRDFAKELKEVERLGNLLERIEKLRKEGLSPAEAEAIDKNIDRVQAKYAALKETVKGQRSWDFGTDVEAAFRHEVLSRLVSDFEDFAAPNLGVLADLERRRALAQGIAQATLTDPAEAWAAARRRILDSKLYDDLDLLPQRGLIPLGPDPKSGLEEFLHWASHARDADLPRRNDDGRFAVSKETGVIFVLLPGGSFLMGAQSENEEQPNYDADATREENPLTKIALEPFFLAKHETTQAQWIRLTGQNPSYYDVGTRARGMTGCADARHPVEQIDWKTAATVLGHFELRLPTEAQWEFAARAGRHVRFPGTPDVRELGRYANIAGREFGAFLHEHSQAHQDPFIIHAPVGQLAPNAWGLHDLCGNVLEWCEDRNGPYELKARGPRGLRTPSSGMRVTRGGSFDMPAAAARLSRRNAMVETIRAGNIGARAARSLRSP